MERALGVWNTNSHVIPPLLLLTSLEWFLTYLLLLLYPATTATLGPTGDFGMDTEKVAESDMYVPMAQGSVWSNASLCSRPTVRPNNIKMLEFGAEKGSLQNHARRRAVHALKKNPTPWNLKAKPSYKKGERGAGLVVAVFLVPGLLKSGHSQFTTFL